MGYAIALLAKVDGTHYSDASSESVPPHGGNPRRESGTWRGNLAVSSHKDRICGREAQLIL